MLGIAQKAGKLSSGAELCEKEIKKGNTSLVIFSQDSSSNTKKKFINMCNFHKVKYIEFGTKEFLGKFIGKDVRSVVCITDDNFAKSVLQKLNGGETIGKTKSI